MRSLTHLRSRLVSLPLDSIDTDQIIPARFLTTTQRSGLGVHLFADWRCRPDGTRPAFPLNSPAASGAEVLVAGHNFGCGSSREHAVWALADHGFRAVVAASFADIFRNNALKNGLLPVELPAELVQQLHASAAREEAVVVIDVPAATITLPGGTVAGFPIDAFARHCLMEGLDPLDFLLGQESAIAAFEDARIW